MSTATRNRASRGASKAALAVAVENDIPAIGALALLPSPEEATEQQSRDIADEMEQLAFMDAFAEMKLGAAVRLSFAANSDDITVSHFMRASIAARGVAENDVDAIAAAREDNPGWAPEFLGTILLNPPAIIGAKLRAYGQRVNNGVRPWSDKERADYLAKGKTEQVAPEGKIIRSPAQHRFWDAAQKRLKFLKKTPEQREADKAARSARASKAGEKSEADASLAALAGAAAILGDAFELPKHGDELFAMLLLVARSCRKAVNDAIAAKVDMDKETCAKFIGLAAYMDAKEPVYVDARNAREASK